jgi:predicted HAD superfamily Cof-like phosphohydrolase
VITTGDDSMSAYEELREKVKQHGVRVPERLELLRLLEEGDAQEELTQGIEDRTQAITAAAQKVKELLG